MDICPHWRAVCRTLWNCVQLDVPEQLEAPVTEIVKGCTYPPSMLARLTGILLYESGPEKSFLTDNPLWSENRFAVELAKLGDSVSPQPSQRALLAALGGARDLRLA
jgi:hypothetical protein